MLIVLGLLLAVFVVPDPWDVPVVLGAIGLEIAETAFWIRFSRRDPPQLGVEAVIGADGRVVEPCRPIGSVRVGGEVWRACCEAGADRDERVRVVGRDGLLLTVERT